MTAVYRRVKASGIPEPEIMLYWLYHAGDLAPQSEQMGVESRDTRSVAVHHYFVLVLHSVLHELLGLAQVCL